MPPPNSRKKLRTAGYLLEASGYARIFMATSVVAAFRASPVQHLLMATRISRDELRSAATGQDWNARTAKSPVNFGAFQKHSILARELRVVRHRLENAVDAGVTKACEMLFGTML